MGKYGEYELVRMKGSNTYFVLRKGAAEKIAGLGNQYAYEVVAKGTQKQMFEFKRLTEES